MDELDFYNPYDDYDEEGEGMVLIEDKPKKRRRKSNPSYQTSAIVMPALLLAIGYLGWCAYASKSGLWSWQPWKKLAGRSRLQLRRSNLNNTEAEKRRQAEFDRAVEESLKPSVVTVDTEIPWRPVYGNTEKERVSFIEP